MQIQHVGTCNNHPPLRELRALAHMAQQCGGQRGFARTGLPHQAKDLPRTQFEIDLGNHVSATVQLHPQVLNAQQFHGVCSNTPARTRPMPSASMLVA